MLRLFSKSAKTLFYSHSTSLSFLANLELLAYFTSTDSTSIYYITSNLKSLVTEIASWRRWQTRGLGLEPVLMLYIFSKKYPGD